MDKLVTWWNLGRNVQVNDEDTATWRELLKDDLSQVTHSDRAFKAGSTSLRSWRPLSAFSPEMLKTGPTPLVRQIVERPFKLVVGAKWRGGREV